MLISRKLLVAVSVLSALQAGCVFVSYLPEYTGFLSRLGNEIITLHQNSTCRHGEERAASAVARAVSILLAHDRQLLLLRQPRGAQEPTTTALQRDPERPLRVPLCKELP